MKLCYLSGSALPSRQANSVHVMKMCAAYATQGQDVRLIVPRAAGKSDLDGYDLFSFYGVPRTFRVVRLRLLDVLPSTLGFGGGMPLTARLLGAEMVHSRSLAAAWGSACLVRLPTVYEMHDTPSANPRLERMLRDLIRSPNLRGVVTITRALAERLSSQIPRDRIFVAPDGVEASAVASQLTPGEARRRLGLATDRSRVVVYAGHLYPGRGVGLILDVARSLDDHLFLIVGGNPGDLERRREQAAGLSNVRFAGFVPPAEVPLYLEAADVLMMPYRDRVEVAGGGDTSAWASPLKMFEYLAAGRPILASTLPVLQEVLEDGVNARLLRHDRPSEWVRALRDLAADSRSALDLAEHALATARRYTWERRAAMLVATFGALRD